MVSTVRVTVTDESQFIEESSFSGTHTKSLALSMVQFALFRGGGVASVLSLPFVRVVGVLVDNVHVIWVFTPVNYHCDRQGWFSAQHHADLI